MPMTYEALVYNRYYDGVDLTPGIFEKAGIATTWDEAYQMACDKAEELKRDWANEELYSGLDLEQMTVMCLVRPAE